MSCSSTAFGNCIPFANCPALRLWLLEDGPAQTGSFRLVFLQRSGPAAPGQNPGHLASGSQSLFPAVVPALPGIGASTSADHPPACDRRISRFIKSPIFCPRKTITGWNCIRMSIGAWAWNIRSPRPSELEPDRITAFALSRRQNDYTERDRAILEMLRPHLVVAFNNLALAGENLTIQDTAALALNELSSATIIVNLQGRILYHTGPGLQWIGAASPGVLPAEISDWLNPPAARRSRRSHAPGRRGGRNSDPCRADQQPGTAVAGADPRKCPAAAPGFD